MFRVFIVQAVQSNAIFKFRGNICLWEMLVNQSEINLDRAFWRGCWDFFSCYVLKGHQSVYMLQIRNFPAFGVGRRKTKTNLYLSPSTPSNTLEGMINAQKKLRSWRDKNYVSIALMLISNIALLFVVFPLINRRRHKKASENNIKQYHHRADTQHNQHAVPKQLLT